LDDSQEQKGLSQARGLEDNALARRIMARSTSPLGVIDMRHAQDHYSRLTEWPAQRLGLLNQLKERYDLSSDEPATGNMVYQTFQEQPTDAEAIHTDTRSSISGGESFEAPKKSTTVARASSDKFRISRKPVSTGGKLTQPDSPTASTQATTESMRGLATHLQQAEARATPPTVESLSKASKIATDSTSTARTPILRLSRKRAGKLDQKSSVAGIDEGGTIAVPDIVHQQEPFVSPAGHDKTSDGSIKERAIVQRAASEEASEAERKRLPVSSEKPSAMDQQSPAKGASHLLLRKSRMDGPMTMTTMAARPSEAKSVSRVVSTGGVASSPSREMKDESVAGGATVRPVAREMKSVKVDGPTVEHRPFVKAETVSSRVQLKPREAARENVGPVTREEEGAEVSSTAVALEMRPASSRGQAPGIVWRKSAGESSQDGPGSSGGNGYSSSSMPLTSTQVQRQAGGESDAAQTGPASVVQRAGYGAGPSQTHAAPEVDLERITEHVSRAIFRQLAIERERRGF
jgi:hypothetical protein